MSLFRKSLQDLIKGIRNPRNDAAEFTSTAIVSIKKELKSMDIAVKAGAVSKLTYLKMLDFDISWAQYEQFYVYELMVIETDARRFVIEAYWAQYSLT